MKTLRYVILCLVTLVCSIAFAQTQEALEQLMRDRNEYYFTLKVNDRAEIQTLSLLCSVDGTDGQTVVCYANQQEYDQLLQLGYRPTLETPPSLREEAKMWDGNRATYAWDSYPTYSAYQSMMQNFPSSVVSGRTCTYMELGTLNSGRKIMGVRINNGSPNGKPKFLYSSTIHGDETTGWIMMLRLIDELCTSTDSRIVNLINSLDIFIFPNTNPDGTYYGGNNSVNRARRANANGVDMNRNYPDPHGSAHPDGKAYQTETQWFMQLAEDYPFVMAANFHGGAEVMNYPWDNTYTLHADDAWWQYVSREYANLVHAVNSSYMTDQQNGITNGAQWYMIGGGRQDYMNGYRQCREITIECSTTKKPSGSSLPTYWNYNHNAMLTYMEECLNGVHGFVYDAATNQALDGVTVTVLNHDDQYSIVTTHEDGDFHRPIKGGTYTFQFEKAGYCTETLQVTVADGQRIELNNITLSPKTTKAITGFGQGTGHYYLIASPIGTIGPDEVGNMLDGSYDLFAFDQNETLEWRNYKLTPFDLEPGQGYLYANSQNKDLVFCGVPYNGNGQVTLTKADHVGFSGWNLVGNPFNATAYIDRNYYEMNPGGTEIMAGAGSIEPMQGLFVVANTDGETLTFSTTAPNAKGEALVLNLSRDRSDILDRAIVRFDEGDGLPKMMLNESHTHLYIPMEGHDYAVVNTQDETGELPLSFKAEENGEYTLNFDPESVRMDYLYLIDQLTGDKVDLLETPSYTFIAKTTDIAHRFRLVFSSGDENADDNNTTFAYYDDGKIHLTVESCHGTSLQIFDMTGRVIARKDATRHISTAGMVPGVYVLRLVNADSVKTQKIIIE